MNRFLGSRLSAAVFATRLLGVVVVGAASSAAASRLTWSEVANPLATVIPTNTPGVHPILLPAGTDLSSVSESVDDEPGRHRDASRRVDRGEFADVVSERGVAGRRPSAPGPRPDGRRRSGDTAEREHTGGRFHTVDCTDRHDRLDRPRATTAIPSTPASSTTVTRSVTTPG